MASCPGSRVPDSRNQRRRVTRITEPGHEFLNRFRDEVTHLKSSMVAPLPPAQAEEARRYVALCRAALDSHRPA